MSSFPCPEDGLHALIRRIAQDDGRDSNEALAAFIDCIRFRLAASLRRQYDYLNEEDIEDIIQYTVVQAWRTASAYRGERGEQSAWAWVFRIAHRRARGPYRHWEAHTTTLDEDQWNAQPAGEASMPEGPTHANRQMLDAFSETLSLRKQAMFKARYEGVDYKTIAAQHGISVPRVSQILHEIYAEARKFFA